MIEKESIVAAASRGVVVLGKFNPKNQKVDPALDGDAAMSLHLLKIAGCKTGEVHFVHPGMKIREIGEKFPGALILDVGGITGIRVLSDLRRDIGDSRNSPDMVVIDHHGEDGNRTCTAWLLAEALDLAYMDGRLEKVLGLSQALEFVWKQDTNQLPAGSFSKSARTILGLARNFGPEKIIAFFAEGNNLETKLTDGQLRSLGLTEVSKKQQKVIVDAFAAIDTAVKIETCEGLKGVAVQGQVIGGSFATYERGYDIFASFTAPSFAVNFTAPQPEVAVVQKRLGEGKVVRGSMILCNETPTTHSFESFVEAINGRGNIAALVIAGRMRIIGISWKTHLCAEVEGDKITFNKKKFDEVMRFIAETHDAVSGGFLIKYEEE